LNDKDKRNTGKPFSTKTMLNGKNENLKEQSYTYKPDNLQTITKVNGKEKLTNTTATRK